MSRQSRASIDAHDALAEELETRLFRILGLVNDWLRFAEAKCVGLIGLASGAMALALGYINGLTSVPVAAGIVLAISGLCLILSLLTGLLSFFPRTDVQGIVGGRRGNPDKADNLYYFGHLAKYSPQHLANSVGRRYADAGENAVEEVHLDLASQIVINSRITLWKLRLFGISVTLFGAGVAMAAIGVGIARLAGQSSGSS